MAKRSTGVGEWPSAAAVAVRPSPSATPPTRRTASKRRKFADHLRPVDVRSTTAIRPRPMAAPTLHGCVDRTRRLGKVVGLSVLAEHQRQPHTGRRTEQLLAPRRCTLRTWWQIARGSGARKRSESALQHRPAQRDEARAADTSHRSRMPEHQPTDQRVTASRLVPRASHGESVPAIGVT